MWIPVDRIVVAAPSPGGSIHLHSLSDADALADNRTVAAAGAAGEYLVLNAPAAVSFPFSPPGAHCSKSLYFVEYREPVRWDAGLPTEASYWSPTSPKQLQEVSKADFPTGSVLLHLSCTSSWDPPPPTYVFSLLVDKEPSGGGHTVSHNANFYSSGAPLGALYPGDEYGDVASNFYVAVNAMSNVKHEATVTYSDGIGPITDTLTLTGPTDASSGGALTASALLKTKQPTLNGNFPPAPPSADSVVPGHKITFTLGANKCSAVTDLDGVATCEVKAQGSIGSKLMLTARAAATRAYLAANARTTIILTVPQVKLPPLPPEPVGTQIRRPLPPVLPRRQGRLILYSDHPHDWNGHRFFGLRWSGAASGAQFGAMRSSCSRSSKR